MLEFTKNLNDIFQELIINRLVITLRLDYATTSICYPWNQRFEENSFPYFSRQLENRSIVVKKKETKDNALDRFHKHLFYQNYIHVVPNAD